MFKFGIALFMSTGLLLLSACTSEAETNNNNPPTDAEEPSGEPEDNVNTSEVLENAIQETEDLDNYSINTNMNQNVHINKEEEIENKYRSQASVNLNPLRYHASSTIDKEETAREEKTNGLVQLKYYFTEDGFYIFDSTEGYWVKFPEEFTNDFQAIDKSFDNPARILELIETYTNEINIEEGNRHYRLTFEGNNEQIQQVALEVLGMINTDFSSSMEDMMYMTEMDPIEFELHIEKETFYTKKIKMNLQMKINNREDHSYSSSHTVVIRYSQFNDTKEVSIPSSIINNAKEMALEEFSGFQDMEEFDTIRGIEIEEFYKEEDTSKEEEQSG